MNARVWLPITALALSLGACAAPDGRTLTPLIPDMAALKPARPVIRVRPRVTPAKLPDPQDEAGFRRLYGAPDFVRKEEGAELWRYDGADCALFVFFYDEQQSYRMRYMETAPHGTVAPADSACLDSVKARAAPRS